MYRLLTCLLLLFSTTTFADSACYDTTAKGKIKGAVQLPNSGKNFSAYSDTGVTLGRNNRAQTTNIFSHQTIVVFPRLFEGATIRSGFALVGMQALMHHSPPHSSRAHS